MLGLQFVHIPAARQTSRILNLHSIIINRYSDRPSSITVTSMSQ